MYNTICLLPQFFLNLKYLSVYLYTAKNILIKAWAIKNNLTNYHRNIFLHVSHVRLRYYFVEVSINWLWIISISLYAVYHYITPNSIRREYTHTCFLFLPCTVETFIAYIAKFVCIMFLMLAYYFIYPYPSYLSIDWKGVAI